jgi:hypothetical protein
MNRVIPIAVVCAAVGASALWLIEREPDDVLDSITDTSPSSTSRSFEPPLAPPPAEIERPAPAERRAPESSSTIARIGEHGVAIKQIRAPHDWPAPGTIAADFASLEQAARDGSDHAAAALHQRVEWCVRKPKTADELSAAEERMRKTFAATGGTNFEPRVTLDEQLASVQRDYERCLGFTPELQERALALLKASADRGEDLHSAHVYATALMKTDPEAARERFTALAEQGSITAIAALGVESLPHRIAWIAYQSAVIAGNGVDPSDPAKQHFLAKYERELREIENSTSPVTLREARVEAVELLRNPLCCKL